MQINQIPHVHLTTPSRRALTVHIPQHIGRTANVEVPIDTAAYPHPTVNGRRH